VEQEGGTADRASRRERLVAQAYLCPRLLRAQERARAALALLWVARVLAALSLALVAQGLWQGWAPTDWLHLLNLALWGGLMLVQRRICARRQALAAQLEREAGNA
jgi:hypothetical protein